MRTQIIPLIASAIAILLQVVVAPIMPIMSVYPNFLVPLVIVLSIVRNPDTTYWYTFVLGLISDLLTNTPLGLTAVLLLGISFALSRAFEVLDKTTLAMPLLAVLASMLVYQVVLAIVLAVLGSGPFMDLFVQRALPATVYGAVIGALYCLITDKLSLQQASHDAWTVSGTQRYR